MSFYTKHNSELTLEEVAAIAKFAKTQAQGAHVEIMTLKRQAQEAQVEIMTLKRQVTNYQEKLERLEKAILFIFCLYILIQLYLS